MGRVVVVVNALIVRDGKVLIVRRAADEDSFPGYWELPGGTVEFGERPVDAVKREVKEETNLDVEVLEPHYIFDWVDREKDKHSVEISYRCRLVSNFDDFNLCEEHSDSRWALPEDLDALKMSEEKKAEILHGFAS